MCIDMSLHDILNEPLSSASDVNRRISHMLQDLFCRLDQRGQGYLGPGKAAIATTGGCHPDPSPGILLST